MRVISRKALRLFWQSHPESKAPLLRWFKIMQHTNVGNIEELRTIFPTADKVENLVVFNIGGNNYRLIASIHFNRDRIYIRHVLTHREYDRGDWKR